MLDRATLLQRYRRHAKAWTALILPLLLLRALVPAGFMVSAGQSGLSFTICTGMSMGTGMSAMDMSGMDMSMPMSAQHGGHATGHDLPPGSGSHSPCPFALSAGAPLPTAALPAPGRPEGFQAPARPGTYARVVFPGPARLPSARAPPVKV